MNCKKKSSCAIIMILALTLQLAGCATLGVGNSSGNVRNDQAVSTADSAASPTLMPGDAIDIVGENNDFSLYSVDFLDENNGWVIRDKYNAAYTETKSQLLRTQDGGDHWSEVGSDDNTLYVVKYVNTEEGWSISQVGDKAELNPGSDEAVIQYTVMHTMDSGATWSVQWEGQQVSTSHLSLWFQDTSSGFALVGNTILDTQNGGKDWSPVSFGVKDFIPQCMSFTDAKTGCVAGVNEKQNVLTVLHTGDGGKNWRRQFQKSNSGSNIMGFIGLDFVDARIGWFLTSDMGTWNGELYNTCDGGSNWNKINQIKCVRPIPMSIHFISSEVGWIPLNVGAGPISGGLMVTRDGGKSFQVVGASKNSDYSDATQKIISAREADFISAQQGWAIGLSVNNGDYLLRTEDGGNTWNQVYPKPTPTQDISFVNNQTGFGLGSLSDFGALLGTTDGGSSWQTIKSLAQDFRPIKLSFIDSRNGWILASTITTNETITLHTSDGGQTWEKLGSLPDNMIAYFRFFDAKNGIAISQEKNGPFYRTQDGGRTWTPELREIPANGIDQFAFLSSTEGWEICNPGGYKTSYDISISHMTNGESWQEPTEVEQGAASYALTFLSEQKAMMLVEEPPYNPDSRMKLLVTEDGGKTWEPHMLPEGTNGATIAMLQNQLSMQFADDLHGWILSAYGLLATQDGGKTWTWE